MGKLESTDLSKSAVILVSTFWEKGGLNQVYCFDLYLLPEDLIVAMESYTSIYMSL